MKLGDTVKIVDRDNGITSKQRVISVDIYPNEPSKNTFQAGRPAITVQEAWQTSFAASQYLRLNKNAGEELKTEVIEFMESNEKVALEHDGEMKRIGLYKTGALFVSSNSMYAIAIMEGKIKIGIVDTENETPDGWNWKSVFEAGKVKVSEVFTGELFTDECTIKSGDRKLEIKDSSIVITIIDCGLRPGIVLR